MALRGTSVGPSVRLETDGGGKPVVGTDPPEAPEGFEASYTLVDTGERSGRSIEFLVFHYNDGDLSVGVSAVKVAL